MTSTFSSAEKPVRLSVPLTPEVHAIFRRLAQASGKSLGKSIGDWLLDTSSAAEVVAEKIEQSRASFAQVGARARVRHG